MVIRGWDVLSQILLLLIVFRALTLRMDEKDTGATHMDAKVTKG